MKINTKDVEYVQKTLVQNKLLKELTTQIRLYDLTTFNHCLQVAVKTVSILNIYGKGNTLLQNEKEDIIAGALIHDIGKIMIPKSILTKPDSLTEEEYKIIQNHAEYGYRYCIANGLNDAICRIVLEHHERDNGTGYPDGKTKDEISFGSKIVAIADSLDAIMQKRSYKEAHTFETAKQRIIQDVNKYDNEIVSLLKVMNN